MISRPADWRWRELPPRTIALLVVVVVHLLLGIMLITLAPPRPTDKPPAAVEARNIPAPRAATPAPAPAARKAAPKPKAEPPAKPPPPPLTFGVQLSEPFDISKLPNQRSQLAQADSDSAVPFGPGQGPGGVPLYNAEWVREPSDAELRGYLPPGVQSGWADIACRSVEGNRVEDCQELGESPRGSRLASALREAAWQFRVRPPRKGGQPMWGTWVRIHFDFTVNGEKPEPR